MSRWTGESLSALRDGLPRFPAELPPEGSLRAFCADYGLAPEQRMPGVEHRAGTVCSGAFSLLVHRWQQPAAIGNLLLVHGYFDHSGLFGKLVEFGLEQNFNVLIFDLPGHGLSTGQPSAIADFADYGQAIADVLAAAALPPLPWLVMAQSMGAAALVEFSRRRQWPFVATVLLAPLIRPAGWLRARAAHVVLHRFIDSVPRDFVDNSSDPDFLSFVRADPLQSTRIPVAWVGALRRWLAALPAGDLGIGPALIIQGDSDRTVDWRWNIQVLARLFPGSRIEFVPAAGHHLANESKALRDRYLAVVSDCFTRALRMPADPPEPDTGPTAGPVELNKR